MHNQPELTVWYGEMPESNGKSNWTAILCRKNAESTLSAMTSGITIARSEYPGRVKYEADCMRYLIGELAEEPDILEYDTNTKSAYAKAREIESQEQTDHGAELDQLIQKSIMSHISQFRISPALLKPFGDLPKPEDPLEWKLPCDLTAGGVTIGKGCSLRTVQHRLQVQHDTNLMLLRARKLTASSGEEDKSIFVAGFMCAGGDVEEARSQAEQFAYCCQGQNTRVPILPTEVPEVHQDTELLNWLESEVLTSYTGVSIDKSTGVPRGFRFLRHHYLGTLKPTLREAIEHARKDLSEKRGGV